MYLKKLIKKIDIYEKKKTGLTTFAGSANY